MPIVAVELESTSGGGKPADEFRIALRRASVQRWRAHDHQFLNQYRVRTGPYASDDRFGFTGMYDLVHAGYALRILASDGSDAPGADGITWQHVSVSLRGSPNRTPPWTVMCEVKHWFWGPDVWVVQYHPAADEYVNNHPGCLHLWRPVGVDLPTPPAWMVGFKGANHA